MANNAMWTIGAQVGRLIIQLVGVVLLSRALAPRDFGLVAMTLAIVAVAEVIREFGLSFAIVQSDALTERQRDTLFWISTSLGAVCATGVWLLAAPIAAFYDEPELQGITHWLSIVFFLGGPTAQYRANLNRELRFRTMGLGELAAATAGLMAALVFVEVKGDYNALVVQQIVYAVAILSWLGFSARWVPGLSISIAETKPLLSYGWKLALSQLLTYGSRNGDSVAIGMVVGAASLGFYDRAFRLIASPMGQLKVPITRLVVPYLSSRRAEPIKFRTFVLAGQTAILLGLGGPLSVAIIIADHLIPMALGPGWDPAVFVFQVFCAVAIVELASYPTYWCFLSLNAVGQNLRFTVWTRPMTVALFFLFTPWGINGVAIGLLVGTLINWLAAYYWLERVPIAPTRDLAWRSAALIALLIVIPSGFALLAVVSSLPSPYFALAWALAWVALTAYVWRRTFGKVVRRSRAAFDC